MRRSQLGFTLVEMLVSLSVAVLLVSLVYGAVRVGQRSAQAMTGQVAEAEALRIGWQFLRDALARTRAVSVEDVNDDPTGFAGRANGLSFIADMPAYVGLGGLMLIDLESEPADGADQLVLSRRRFDPSSGQPTEQGTQRAVLVDDLESIEIAYFGESESADGPDWQTNWQGADTLPRLVRIQIAPAGSAAWPEIVVRLFDGRVAGFTPSPDDATSGDDEVSDDGHDDPDIDLLEDDH